VKSNLGLPWQKQQRTLTSKVALNLRKKLMKHFNRSTVLYSAETWGLRKINRKYVESFEMWCWGMKICCSNNVRNEDALQTVKKERDTPL